MNAADLAFAVFLVSLTTVPVLDAFRRRGALARAEFYLLVALYVYATGGYLTYMIVPGGTRNFLLPATDLAAHTGYLYSAYAILAVYVGGKLYRGRDPQVPSRVVGDRTLAALALAGCVVGLAANAYYFAAFGLFSGGFDRVEFIDDFGAAGGATIPYLAIFYASIAVLALNEWRPTSWLMLAVFALLHLPVGNRRIVLAALMIVFVAKLLRGTRFRIGVLAAVLAVVLVLGIVVGDVRGEGLSALAGLDLKRVFLALSEFARPFVTLAYYVEYGYEPLYGTSLLHGFVNALPGSLLPFEKPASLGREFVEVVEELGVYGGERVPGFGFFPVTEALLNFGPLGVPAFFLAFAAGVRWLSSFVVRRGFPFVVPVVCAYMFAIGRDTFGGVLAACLWASAVGLAVHLAARAARQFSGYRRLVGRAGIGLER